MNKTLSPVISDLAKVDELQEKYFGDNPEKIGNYFFQEINQFFYENTVNSSFNEEELMILIYLLLEELILVKMPKSFISLYSKNEGFFGKDFFKLYF
jgi:hypothetical protein